MQKMTVANKFDEVVNFITGDGQVSMSQDEIIDFLLDRKAKSIKKNVNRKLTERQIKNEEIKTVLFKVLADESKTVKDLMQMDEVVNADDNVTSARLSGILTQLVKNGEMKAIKDGKVNSYTVA